MKVEEIEKLLNTYYEGNTTEQEEEILKEYFATHPVPEHLEQDKKLFLCFRNEEKEKVPAGLEDKLAWLIDRKEEEELRFFQRNKAKRNWRWIGGIAATFVLLVAIGYGTDILSPCPIAPEDTYENPQEAYEMLQSTLIEVSAQLNQGIDQVSQTRTDIKEINKEINQEIQ